MLGLLLATVPGCAGTPAAVQAPVAAPSGARSALTDARGYLVAYAPSPDPPPLNEIFALEVLVTDAARPSRLAAGVEIGVSGWMPEHEHGTNLVPEVRSLGEGRFAVDGMLFHMPGLWQLKIEVRRGTAVETATFDVRLE